MIASLHGKIRFKENDSLIVEVQGVGYQVFGTKRMRELFSLHEDVFLYIHTIMRDSVIKLYGFETKEELFFFQKLISVSGLGPQSALSLLDLASPDTLYRAIMNSQIDYLSSIPGIGKKTAEKICLELRDKLEEYEGEKALNYPEDKDALDALLALGYSVNQAYQALSQVPEEIKETKERIREALKYID